MKLHSIYRQKYPPPDSSWPRMKNGRLNGIAKWSTDIVRFAKDDRNWEAPFCAIDAAMHIILNASR